MASIVNAELVSLWRASCFRARVTASRLRSQWLHVMARRVPPLAPSRSRTRVVQLYPWTYSVILFASGVAVGAFLVMFARNPSYPPTVPMVATVVSANPAPEPSSRGRSSVGAPSGRSVGPPAPVDSPVSTRGVGLAARPSARPAQQAPREDVPPRPQRAFQGSLHINSRPAGAAVFMNGRHIGTTPTVLENLPIGSRAVRVTLAGYEPWSKSVQVVADQRTTVTAALQESGNQ